MPGTLGGVSTLAGGNLNFIWLYYLPLVISLASIVSLHTCTINQRLRKIFLHISIAHTLSLFLSLQLSPLLYLVSQCCEFYMPWPPQTLNSVSFNSRNCWILFKFFFPGLRPGNSLRRLLGDCEACFSSLRDDCSVLPIVHCLKTIVLHFFLPSVVVV